MVGSWFAAGAVSAALGVGLGAFGAHGLRSRVEPAMLAVWETGVRYHLLHAVGLLAVAWAAERWAGSWTQGAGWAFLAGTLVFSGSLYAMTLGGPRWLGAITPLGGLCFIGGWLALAVAAMRG